MEETKESTDSIKQVHIVSESIKSRSEGASLSHPDDALCQRRKRMLSKHEEVIKRQIASMSSSVIENLQKKCVAGLQVLKRKCHLSNEERFEHKRAEKAKKEETPSFQIDRTPTPFNEILSHKIVSLPEDSTSDTTEAPNLSVACSSSIHDSRESNYRRTSSLNLTSSRLMRNMNSGNRPGPSSTSRYFNTRCNKCKVQFPNGVTKCVSCKKKKTKKKAKGQQLKSSAPNQSNPVNTCPETVKRPKSVWRRRKRGAHKEKKCGVTHKQPEPLGPVPSSSLPTYDRANMLGKEIEDTEGKPRQREKEIVPTSRAPQGTRGTPDLGDSLFVPLTQEELQQPRKTAGKNQRGARRREVTKSTRVGGAGPKTRNIQSCGGESEETRTNKTAKRKILHNSTKRRSK